MPVRTRTVMVHAVGDTCRFYPCPALATRAPFLPGRRTGKSPGRRLAVARAWVSHHCLVVVLLVEGLLEVADLALGVILLPAIALLQLAGQVLGIAYGHVEHVVGEVAPLGLHLALKLLPVASDDVAVHACSL